MARELSIRITADDSAAKGPLARTEQGVKKVEGAAVSANKSMVVATGGVNSLGKAAEQTGAKFNGVTGIVQRGSGLMTGALAGIAGGLGVGAIVTLLPKLGELGAKFISTGGQIQDAADKLGVSTDAIQRWQFAVDQTGGSMAAVETSAIFLRRRLAEGGDSVVAALRELGFELGAIRAMAPEKQYETLADSIGKIQDPLKQAEVGAELMGRGFATNLAAMKEGFGALGDEAQAAGAIMSETAVKAGDELGDAWSKLLDVGANLLSAVFMPILPVLTDLLEIVVAIIKPLSDLLRLVLEPIGFVLGLVSEGIKILVGWITDLFDPVGKANSAMKEFAMWLREQIAPAIAPVIDLLIALKDMFFAFGELVFAVHVKVVTAIAEMVTKAIFWIVDKFRPIWEPFVPVLQKIGAAFETLKNIAVAAMKALYEGVKTWLVDRFSSIVSGIKEKIDAVTGFFNDMYKKVVGGSIVPDMINGIEAEFAKLDQVMLQPVIMITDQVEDRFRTMLRSISEQFASWGDDLGSFISGKLGGILGSGFGGIASGIVSAFGGILTGGLTSIINMATGLAVQGIKKLGGLIWDGLKAIGSAVGNFFGGLFGGNQTAGSREDFARNMGFGNLGALYDKLGSMGPQGEALRHIGLNVIGKGDKAANERWMQDVLAFLQGGGQPPSFAQPAPVMTSPGMPTVFEGAETEEFPSFQNRPLERVTKAGLVMTHPGDVVGVPTGRGAGSVVNVTVHAEGSIFRGSRRSAREFADAIASELTLVLNNANT